MSSCHAQGQPSVVTWESIAPPSVKGGGVKHILVHSLSLSLSSLAAGLSRSMLLDQCFLPSAPSFRERERALFPQPRSVWRNRRVTSNLRQLER